MSPANKTVPDVSGKTIAEARVVIEGQDLQGLVKREKSTVIRLQKVMSFEPIPMQGSSKKEQSRIDLIVSKGPNSFEMPNYGENTAAAEEDLKTPIKYRAK